MNCYLLEKEFRNLKGKVIAVVYIFEGETAPGYKHYHIWRSKVLNGWISAIYDIDCIPYITDLRNFVERAFSGTLPHIDFVLNLNCGAKKLSTLGVLPSIASFLNIPIIPCDTDSLMVGENKLISNHLAKSIGLKVPNDVNRDYEDAIFRPISLGSSVNVKKSFEENGLYQEFIHGLDITTPFVYHPIEQRLEPFPSLIYISNSNDTQWYFGEKEKLDSNSYKRYPINLNNEKLLYLYKKLIDSLNIKTFCRIDSRIKCNNINEFNDANALNTYFLEINTMPTIKENNSFGLSFSSIEKSSSFGECIEIYQNVFNSSSVHGFLLLCSLISLCKEIYYEKNSAD